MAASAWDFEGRRSPLSLFWRAARQLDDSAPDESARPGAHGGDLERIFRDAGLRDVRGGELSVTVGYGSANEWWSTYTLGVGPPGDYVAHLDDEHRDALRGRAVELFAREGPTIKATAWTAFGRVPRA